MQGRQALVAGPDMIATVALQVAEAVSEAVQMGRCYTVGDRERQLDDELVKGQARAAGVHAAPTVEGKQRCVRG